MSLLATHANANVLQTKLNSKVRGRKIFTILAAADANCDASVENAALAESECARVCVCVVIFPAAHPFVFFVLNWRAAAREQGQADRNTLSSSAETS